MESTVALALNSLGQYFLCKLPNLGLRLYICAIHLQAMAYTIHIHAYVRIVSIA